MNRRMVLFTVGRIMMFEAALMLLPAAVAAIYGEACITAFLWSVGAALLLGLLLTVLAKPGSRVIFAKEGFITVALAWILLSAVGALPFYLSGEIPSYVDAFFETVSGFTTTGSSIVRDVSKLSHGILFWRSFTHWVGGMGILVFVTAIIPTLSDRSMHMLRAEMPGPIIGKLVPRAKKTAKILYLIYIVMTAVEIVLLYCGGMPLFDSLLHSFGTAGTGGFGIKPDSITGYSAYSQWVITIFMLLFGINFNLYYLALIKHFRNILKSGELWCYLGIVGSATALIIINIMPIYNNFSKALRLSAFQVSSIITTTGYSTCDFNKWPLFSKTILLLLMFMGGCAGSTAGGIKVSRFLILFKSVRRDLKRLLHPRSFGTVMFEGKKLGEDTISSVNTYLAVYTFLLFGIFLLLSLDSGFNIETNLSAAVSCFNNVGPAFDIAGPFSSFADYSVLSKIVLSIAMLLGRLEIYPILLLAFPSTWAKK